jgi:hypothetical protein
MATKQLPTLEDLRVESLKAKNGEITHQSHLSWEWECKMKDIEIAQKRMEQAFGAFQEWYDMMVQYGEIQETRE